MRAIFPGHKVGNEYAALLGDAYNAAPKAVLAAVAVSFATQLTGSDALDEAKALVVREWWTLHRNGIVSQKPPFPDWEIEVNRGQ